MGFVSSVLLAKPSQTQRFRLYVKWTRIQEPEIRQYRIPLRQSPVSTYKVFFGNFGWSVVSLEYRRFLDLRHSVCKKRVGCR